MWMLSSLMRISRWRWVRLVRLILRRVWRSLWSGGIWVFTRGRRRRVLGKILSLTLSFCSSHRLCFLSWAWSLLYSSQLMIQLRALAWLRKIGSSFRGRTFGYLNIKKLSDYLHCFCVGRFFLICLLVDFQRKRCWDILSSLILYTDEWESDLSHPVASNPSWSFVYVRHTIIKILVIAKWSTAIKTELHSSLTMSLIDTQILVIKRQNLNIMQPTWFINKDSTGKKSLTFSQGTISI